ncbi:MAG: hypothetical protein PF541_05280 [Prolixibacteraceae bacterium]|jgi:hypothetical protein|nr:hypothetical protein [Prolixibacteraceae bacterium]
MKLNFIIITVLTCILFISLNSEATTYYISSNGGNDANSGISIDLPWKTINQVNSFAFVAGDSILFKKNEIWRGQLLPRSGNSSSDVYHGAYSSGKFPTILGSLCFNNPSDWISIGGNIWKCNKSFLTDIGNIIFNNSTAVGFKKWNLKELQNQNEFWYNLSSRELLIYSTSNPASLYSKIELALRKHIINQQNTSFVTYENISIKYGGAHGFGGGNTTNITVKSCEISYIGGGDLNMDGKIRFGNGIEFWGNASNIIVEIC